MKYNPYHNPYHNQLLEYLNRVSCLMSTTILGSLYVLVGFILTLKYSCRLELVSAYINIVYFTWNHYNSDQSFLKEYVNTFTNKNAQSKFFE